MKKFLSQNEEKSDGAVAEEPPTKKARTVVTSDEQPVSEQLNGTSSSNDTETKILENSNESILSMAEINQARKTAESTDWITHNDIMYKFNNAVHRSSQEMITFDMDGTLITTKSGKTFPVNENDWKLFDPCIPSVLQRLHSEGKYLAIISNQNGVKAKKTTEKAVQDKVDAIMALLNVPVDFICAMEDDKFRKPRTGMLEFLILARCTDAMRSKSFYVGDAAGRAKEGTRGKDFSDTDLKLALNLDIQFQTPERFFLGSTQRLHNDVHVTSGIRLCDVPVASPPDPIIFTIDPPPTATSTATSTSTSSVASERKQDIVLLVAPPACGKTTLTQQFVSNGYIRINQDTLKSLDKCIAAGRKHLQQGGSICVDNTNMESKARAKWIELAREFNVKARCVVLQTPKEVCRSLAMFRMLDPYTAEEDRRTISSIVINTYFKEPMKWPSLAEGFARIDTVNWSPIIPRSIKSLRLFRMYLK